jgi:hypothetical protein
MMVWYCCPSRSAFQTKSCAKAAALNINCFCPSLCHCRGCLDGKVTEARKTIAMMLDWSGWHLPLFGGYWLLKIWVHLQQFLAHPKRAKRFFRTQKNFFLNKKQWKFKQGSKKWPKTEEIRAFENLLAHFGCAKNPLSIPKRTECCKWTEICSVVSVDNVWTIDGSLLLLNLLDLLFYSNKVSAGYVHLNASSVLRDDVLIPFPLKITRAKHGDFPAKRCKYGGT